MTFMEIKFSGTISGVRYENAKATIYKGTPLSDPPKSYVKAGIVRHSITDLLSNQNRYNSDLATIYRSKTGYHYEIYRDGCFYPYYGKFVIKGE
jgi:hypothetical protein